MSARKKLKKGKKEGPETGAFEKMAGAEGFELSTCGFGDRRSNQLS